jgi:hypothetical protein
MKKQTLLGAVALTTIVVAGHANAANLTATKVGAATVTDRVILANDFTISGDATKGTVGLAFVPSSGAVLPAGNSILSIELKGGATFGTEVKADAIVTNVGCNPTTSITSGGRSGDKTVSFLVSSLAGCTNTVPMHLLLPLQLDGSNTAINIEAGMKTELGTVVDGGVASTYDSKNAKPDLIGFKNAITVTTVADTVLTQATLVSKFKALDATDKVLGTFKVTVADHAKGIDDVTKTGKNSDITNVVLTLKGDFSTVDLKATTSGGFDKTFTEATKGSGTATVSASNPGDILYTIGVTEKADTPVIKGSHYNLSAQLTAAGYKSANLAIASTQIQTLTRQGAAYLLPWVASGSLAAESGSNTVVRLANIGTDATGPVSIELLTSSKGVAASTSLVPVSDAIAKGGELILTSEVLQEKLGADWGRGDIRVTVEGQPEALIVRRFIQQTSGNLSEVSLGRDSGGNEPRN